MLLSGICKLSLIAFAESAHLTGRLVQTVCDLGQSTKEDSKMAVEEPEPNDERPQIAPPDYAMKYTAGGWEALVEEVENQGGALQPEPHLGERIEYKAPQQEIGGFPPAATCGCGNETRMVSTYDPGDDVKADNGSGFVQACAVCDGMGAWPRYEEAVREADTSFWDALEASA